MKTEVELLKTELAIRDEQLETERIRLAGCGVAAMCNTEESMQAQLITPDNPYYSASYRDVLNCVEREMLLRKKYEKLKNLILLVDPSVSNQSMNELSALQWSEFIKAFPSEGHNE